VTAPSIPTTPAGYTSDLWTFALGDVYENVPDCVWPSTVMTYSYMRRDPRLTGILEAYKLPITRAAWSINPAGCRPEAVKLVADGLGIPIAGMDEPGAARTRGVSWAEHLRLALTALDFGHSVFELHAETGDQAKLVGLFERPQSTISTIHVDRQGALTGVSQDGRGESKAPEMPARDIVWYARNREGTNWPGTSLLRPAYAPWLLKREMQRVHATGNRRFGMGVPTIEWAQGTNPTWAQQSAALNVAQQSRTGDQAGAALPPGASLVLRGLSGSVPDTLAFIRWLDQQMSQMALAGFMDLGDTANGSRALGESFIDLYMLALQSTADYIADTVTRSVAARIIEWNFGEDEPVPAVQVADVGTRYQVTAEALNSLLGSGALSADPGLESWVRRTYRLPERETPAPVKTATRSPKPKEQVADPDVEEGERVAAAVGVGHPDSCETASLISPCVCGCNGTRHGERRSRTRLGPIRSEEVERRDGNVRLAGMTDDELSQLFARHSNDSNWDALSAVDAEMVRREDDSKWVNNKNADDHWNIDGEPSEQDRQMDALLARGYDFVEAYAEIHGQDPEKLRSQERSTVVDKASGETTEAAVRRGYDSLIHEQWIRAETDTRGHLLTKQAAAAGVQAIDLFSGPASRARKWASEDLQRWWADNGRMTFGQYKAQVLGRSRDKKSAEKTRLGGNDKDFI
jgi:hypothetical protein